MPLSISMPAQMIESARELAAARETTVSALVRELLIAAQKQQAGAPNREAETV